MANSGGSDGNQHTNHDAKITTIWGVILGVVFIVIVAAICFIHRALRGQTIRQRIEAQLPRYNATSGLGKETVESMPIITFNPRIHSQQISTPVSALSSPSDYSLETKPSKRGIRFATLRKLFTFLNISRGSSVKGDGLATPSGDSTSVACSICTEDFVESTKLRMLPCGHLFHPQCIDQWLTDRSRTCPLW